MHATIMPSVNVKINEPFQSATINPTICLAFQPTTLARRVVNHNIVYKQLKTESHSEESGILN